MEFLLNDQKINAAAPPGLQLLDFIRYHRHLTGTKCGCREGDCGACTVLIGKPSAEGVAYRAVTSCLMPLANVQGKHVVTVEGINPPKGALTPVQQAMVAENGTQCGFCTVGFVMSMTGFCLDARSNSPEAAIAAVDGNICRCTGYKSIEKAAARLNTLLDARNGQNALTFAVENGVVPAYFLDIPQRLANLEQPFKVVKGAAEAMPVGGGTDVYVQRAETMVHAPARHLSDHSEWLGIQEVGDTIEIGASTTVTDWMESPLMQALFPRLQEHLKLVSSTPIRNMATVAGNLANASPIGDLTIWLLALDARVRLHSANGTRELPLRTFYTGYKTLAKTPEEWIESIVFDRPKGDFRFNFEKVCKRTYLDIASVNTALSLRLDGDKIAEAHVSAGGVSPIPLYLTRTSAFLAGKMMRALPDWLPEAQSLLQSEASPISDVRGTANYKRLLLNQLFQAHFYEIFP
jgi:xanthine dehydrogenase small subunit